MSEWPLLTEELDAWNAAGLTATLWWRDDDAIEPTDQLERLLSVAVRLPIALSVVSGLAMPALAERLRDCERVMVLQHGWHHHSHCAPHGNSEYPRERSAQEVLAEFQNGRERMSEMFSERFQAVFVPPWHSFDDKFLPLLTQSGIGSISRGGPRVSAVTEAGIFQCNIHTVLIRWTHPPAFGSDGTAINSLVKHLQGRRLGKHDPAEPTGILTHHLVQDSPTWDFIERLAEVTCAHRAAKWLAASDIFPKLSDDCLAIRAKH